MSIVSTEKIVSPSPDDLSAESFCKVKGFEGNLCKIVALGTEHEMKKKRDEMEFDGDTGMPPKKKRCLEVKHGSAKKYRKGQKENRTPSPRKKGEKKKGNIIIVRSQMQ